MAILVLLMLVVSATSLAQGENLNSPPQDIDPNPVILSRTVTPEGVNTTVEIPVQKDTYITSNLPDTNWCTSNWLRLGYNQELPTRYGAERVFMRFDLSSIPPGAAINSASFYIYMHTATPAGDSAMRVESRHLLNDWDDCQITWANHQPDWGAVFGSSWVGSTLGWLYADATDLVKDWVYGTHPNYGAMLMGDETVRERQRIFYSREDAGGRYPRLIVDYTEYVDTEPPVVTVHSLPAWSPSSFTVTWSGYDPGGSGIDYYDVQYRVSGGGWIDWLNHTQMTSASFAGGFNGTTYEFRARGVDKAGNVQAWSPTPQAWTRVDSVAPSASANSLPPTTLSSSFIVSWTGSDNSGGSGIQSFDVQYQENGGAWENWLIGTTSLSAQATGAEHGVTYGFRVRATDVAGNVQPWSPTAQTETEVYLKGPLAWIEPFFTVVNDDQFLVRWNGEPAPSTSIVSYDIRYNFRKGSWSTWLGNTSLTEETFTDLRTQDGVYCFEARATDSLGRTGDWLGQQCVAVDRYPPFLEPRQFMPIVFKDSQ
jgi:hypothetical protein